MSLRVREQFICCVFAVILFLTGTCVEIPSAGSSFLYASEASQTDVTGSVLRDGSSITTLENVCAISMLRRDETTFLSSNESRSLMKRFLRNVAALLAFQTLLFFIFCYGVAEDWPILRRNASHVTIVRYIQQTDGKK